MNKRIRMFFLLTLLVSCVCPLLTGCGQKEEEPGKNDSAETQQLRQQKEGK